MEGFALLHKLVGIPSVTGSESAAVDFFAKHAKSDGFAVKTDAVGNFIAEAGRGSTFVLFVGHIDTVSGFIPVRVEGEVLHGRGTVDAKAPLVAFYEAAKEHVRSDRLRIRVVGAIDEEGDSRGCKALDRSEKPAFVIVGEPSGSDGVTLGYKGIIRGTLTIRRPHHHGAHAIPSAADELLAFWSEVGKTFDFQEHFDWIQGRLLGLASENDGLTDVVVARFALRLPPGMTTTRTVKRMQELATRRGATFDFAEMMEPAVVDKRSRLVAAYLSAIRAEGGQPRLKQKTGTADFNHLHEWWPDVPIVAYGPGDASLDHTPQEHITRTEFERGVRVNRRVLERLAETSIDAAASLLMKPAAAPKGP